MLPYNNGSKQRNDKLGNEVIIKFAQPAVAVSRFATYFWLSLILREKLKKMPKRSVSIQKFKKKKKKMRRSW